MLQVVKNVDTVTGEIMSEKRKYIQDTLNEEGYRVPAHKLKSCMFAEVPFPDGMTDTEIGRMARLSKHMIATSNMLGYRKSGVIRAYTDDGIIKLVGLSQYRGKEFIERMISMGVMQKVTRSYNDNNYVEYYVNPAYFFAGKRVSLNLYLLFREKLDPIIPDWVKREFLAAAREK